MAMNQIAPFLLFGTVALFMVALIAWGMHYAKQRAKDLSDVAQQVGFTFVGKNWSGPSLSSPYRTSILQRTHGKFDNVMTGSTSGLKVSLFDYRYTVGKSSVVQTVAIFTQDLQLPPFELRPEGLLDRIGDAVIHKDIDFDSHPEFSRRYLLRSPDEESTRKFFTPSLLTYMEQTPPEQNWTIEAVGTSLIFYRGFPLKPADIPAFLDQTSAIARNIVSSGGITKTTGPTGIVRDF